MATLPLRSLALAGAVALAGMAPATASAQSSKGVSIAEAVTVMAKLGHAPEILSEDTDTEPLVGGTYKDGDQSIKYNLKLYECSTGGVGCKKAMVYATFDYTDAFGLDSLTILNEFNDSSTYGRAFAYEGAVGVDIIFVVDSPDPKAFLQRRIEEFPAVVADFVSYY